MKFNKLLPIFFILAGLSLTGCGNSNDNSNSNTSEPTTNSSISNNINGVFDGYQYNSRDYNLDNNTYDRNYSNGYKKSSNNRFGDGMKGAENIRGNENKNTKGKISSDVDNIYNKEKNMYNNIKNDIKDSIRN